MKKTDKCNHECGKLIPDGLRCTEIKTCRWHDETHVDHLKGERRRIIEMIRAEEKQKIIEELVKLSFKIPDNYKCFGCNRKCFAKCKRSYNRAIADAVIITKNT